MRDFRRAVARVLPADRHPPVRLRAGGLGPDQIRASVVASLMAERMDPALVRLSEAQTTCADQ